MKVSDECIKNVIIPAIRANCNKQDAVTMEPIEKSTENVFHYLNRLNMDIKPDQTIYGNMNLSDMLLPSGLAAFLMPRRIQLDINNRLQPNLKFEESYVVANTICYKPQYEIKDIERNGAKRKEQIVTWHVADDYCYSDFLVDLTRLKVAMRVNDIELNTSVAQAMKDVDILTIVDKVEHDGKVKWDGSLGSEFVPYRLIDGFNMGLNYDAYTVEVDKMILSLFNSSVKQVLTK